jgi:hypothetical protein
MRDLKRGCETTSDEGSTVSRTSSSELEAELSKKVFK